MKLRKAGRRHYLLPYQRAMSRLFWATLPLGLILVAFWWWGSVYDTFLPSPFDYVVFGGAVAVLAFSCFAMLARRMSYVQPRADHLSVVTPFLRLKISYRRIKSVHSASFQQLFSPQQATWAVRRFLEPFYGKTVVVVDLANYPLSRAFLRLFFPPQAFSPQTTGFVFVVKDWMALSTDIDTFLGNWKQARQNKRSTPSPFGLMK